MVLMRLFNADCHFIIKIIKNIFLRWRCHKSMNINQTERNAQWEKNPSKKPLCLASKRCLSFSSTLIMEIWKECSLNAWRLTSSYFASGFHGLMLDLDLNWTLYTSFTFFISPLSPCEFHFNLMAHFFWNHFSMQPLSTALPPILLHLLLLLQVAFLRPILTDMTWKRTNHLNC